MKALTLSVPKNIDDFRGKFHLTPPLGWMNDPNGFSYFKNQYHLFYQHNPKDSVWGPMCWGHAVSNDLIFWNHLPIALRPDQPYDANGCFSGSAVTLGENHILFYTGHFDPNGPKERRETQCISVGNGIEYKKFIHNPVIAEDLLPKDSSLGDFRDPKIWRENNIWYCITANANDSGNGRLLLFSSDNLEKWRFIGTLLKGGTNFGGMWECPDYFKIDEQDVLLWSAIGIPPEEGKYQNEHSVLWSIGKFDKDRGVFNPFKIMEVDKGPDFYAPQTLRSPDGRIIMVGWMQNWLRSMPTHELGLGWAGSMTIPREIEIIDETLVQKPIRELEKYRIEEIQNNVKIKNSIRLPNVASQYLDLEISLETSENGTVGLKFFVGKGEETVFTWDSRSNWLTLDRSKSGFPIRSLTPNRPNCQIYRAHVLGNRKILEIRAILDRSSIEIFVDEGRIVFSMTIFPQPDSDGIEIFAKNGIARAKYRAWKLKPPSE